MESITSFGDLINDITYMNIPSINFLCEEEFKQRISRCRNIGEIIKVTRRTRKTYYNKAIVVIGILLEGDSEYTLLLEVIQLYRDILLNQAVGKLIYFINRRQDKIYLLEFLMDNNIFDRNDLYIDSERNIRKRIHNSEDTQKG